MITNPITSALLGLAVGDAVGVPFEFKSREEMVRYPAKGMIGYGTHNQPAGTWSDDSSLTFCLAESLVDGYDLVDIAQKFIQWKNTAYWTAWDKVFDIGITTAKAISRLDHLLRTGQVEELYRQKYYGDEYDNGNGSLMRILPLLFYLRSRPIKEQFNISWEVSALTHRHVRAAMSCLIYLRVAEHLLAGDNKADAYQKMREEVPTFWDEMDFVAPEREHFARLIQHDIRETPVAELKTGGYVIEVLESSIYFFLQCDTYEDTVLSIINLGPRYGHLSSYCRGLSGTLLWGKEYTGVLGSFTGAVRGHYRIGRSAYGSTSLILLASPIRMPGATLNTSHLRLRPMRHLLFICSRNEWRSRTAETLFRDYPGVTVRSAGTSPVARIRINKTLLEWADTIYVMEQQHLAKLRHRFGRGAWEARVTVLNIPDEYGYMDEELVRELRDAVRVS